MLGRLQRSRDKYFGKSDLIYRRVRCSTSRVDFLARSAVGSRITKRRL